MIRQSEEKAEDPHTLVCFITSNFYSYVTEAVLPSEERPITSTKDVLVRVYYSVHAPEVYYLCNRC